jgi:chromate transporter
MTPTSPRISHLREVFSTFLLLGLTSFGGPIAHLGYFRTEFVERRRWLSDSAYADLVALCQFLPGPASSQVGFALGMMRAGPWGAAAAWTAFTLPSAMALMLFAIGATLLDGPVAVGIVHGLKITAVAVIAHAVWGMTRNLCPDRQRAGIALAAVFAVLMVGGPFGQLAAIGIGIIGGLALCRHQAPTSGTSLAIPVSTRAGHVAALSFIGLLAGLPLLNWINPTATLAVMDAFYRAGALVFGGGHVVLPLLEAELVQSGRVSPEAFIAGYGAAQAVPGPLFTFAAYLGMVMNPLGGVAGAALALAMIFVPGLLLLIAVLPHWNRVSGWPAVRAMMQGANAAVVGILGAALYHPVWTSTIIAPSGFALALSGFLLLSVWRWPAWAVVLLMGLGGMVISLGGL